MLLFALNVSEIELLTQLMDNVLVYQDIGKIILVLIVLCVVGNARLV